jgi:hypothetical protein
MSGGGARIFVDQATQDWSSEDPFAVEVGNCGVAIVVPAVGNALGDALMRAGRVVVHLVFGQDGAQMAWVSRARQFRTNGTREGAAPLTSRTARIPAIRWYIRSSELPNVEPGDRTADDHALDLGRTLEDLHDPGGRGSFCRSAACAPP